MKIYLLPSTSSPQYVSRDITATISSPRAGNMPFGSTVFSGTAFNSSEEELYLLGVAAWAHFLNSG